MPQKPEQVADLQKRLNARMKTGSPDIRPSEYDQDVLSRLGDLAQELSRRGFETNAPSRIPQLNTRPAVSTAKTMREYRENQKNRTVLPQNNSRTEKNSPTSTSDSRWGSSNFGSGLQMPTFDSQKLTAGDVAESVGNSAFQGVFGELANSLYSVAAGAENLFEKYLLGYDDPEELAGVFQSLRDLQAQDYNTRQEQIADTSEKSPVMEVVNNLVPDTARNLRDLLLSMATGGAWAGVKAAPAAEQLSRQILAASQGAGAQARQYISDVMTNPQFYSVLAETIGGSYSDAIDKGATEEQALISSALSAIPNALIEVGGGTEDIVRAIGSNQFKGGIRAAMQLGESALEEAGEEILQDAVSGVVEKGTWDYDRPTFTGNFDADEDAVYNLARMLESAGYAMAGTLITAGAGGAIQRGTTRILTDADRVSVGSGIKKADGGDQLLKIAAASESQEVQAQRSEIMGKLKRGQNVSAYSLGKLAESLSNDATINLVTATKRVHTADNTQRTQAMPIDNQSAEKVSAIDAEIRRYTTGAVQNANAMTAQQTDSEVIEEYASRLGENGQKAFRQVAGKTGSGSFQRVKNAFQAYYNYGNWGKKLEDVSSAFSDALTSDQAYQAFTAGQNDAAASLQAQTASAVKAQGKGRLLSSSAASMVDGDTRKYLDEIGRALGVQIEIEAGERDASGNLISNGRVEGGKIYLSAASQKPIASVLNHELTHVLQERSPEQYRAYKNFVASYLDSQNSGWFESQVQRMIDGYDSIGESISREMAEDEVVSDAAERFLSDETAIKELVKENRSVAQRVLGAIRDIIRKLANIVRGDNDAESTASRILREQEEVFRQAEKMWAKALAESSPKSSEKKSSKNKKSSAGKAEKVRFSLRMDDDGNPVVLIDQDIFAGHEGESRSKVIRDFLRQHIGEYYTIIESGQRVYLGKDLPDEYTRSKYTQSANKTVKYVKGQAAQNLGELIQYAYNARSEAARHAEKHKRDAKYGFNRYSAVFAIQNFQNLYTADLVIRNDADGKSYLYDVVNIHKKHQSAFGRRSLTEPPDSPALSSGGVSPGASKEGDQVPNGKQKSSLPVYVHDELDSSWPSSNSSISETTGEINRQNGQTSSEIKKGRRQLNLDNWRDAMTDEEARLYYQLQDELDAVIADIQKTSKRIAAIRDSEEYKSFSEMKKASGQMRGRFAHFSAEDMEEYPFLKELTELRAYNNSLRTRSNELAEEQYPIELKAKERLREAEKDKPALSYSENSEEALERREKVLAEYGTTRSWGETGYILKGGEQLNFRGGSTRGSRSVDHREVNQFFDEDDMSPSEAMVAFIREGNIRVMPEVPGITIAMGTTVSDAQEKALGRYISSKGNELFLVDIINDKGDNLDTLTYEQNVRLDKVLRDIRYFLKNGKRPEESVTAMFHSKYQLALTDDDEYEFSHAQPETVALSVEWMDSHISNVILMDESGTMGERVETVKRESVILKNVAIDDEQLRKITDRMLRQYDSRMDVDQLFNAVKSAVEHIRRRGVSGYGEALLSIYEQMGKALEASESLDKSLWDSPDVKEIRKSIRETRLYISDDQKRDFQNFAEYKRDHRQFKLVNDPTAMPVDQFYTELSEKYPEHFDPSKTTAKDELDEISEWLEAVKPTVVNRYAGNVEQVAADATLEILHMVNAEKSKKPEAKLTRKMIAQQERYKKRYQELKERAKFRMQHEQAGRALDRQRAAERIKDIRAKNREANKRAADRRAISLSRKKIERLVNNLSRKLVKPTDTQNIPAELRGAVSRFLQVIDFRSYGQFSPEVLKELRKAYGNQDIPWEESHDQLETLKTQRWQELQNVLTRISRKEDGNGFEGVYFTIDPDLEDRIRELIQAGVPVNLSNISREQIEELEKLVRAVDHMVRYAGKVRIEGQMLEATETARQIIEENPIREKGTRKTTKLAIALKRFKYDLKDPIRYFDMFGEGFKKVMKNVRNAEKVKISYWRETEKAFEKMLEDADIKKREAVKWNEDYKSVLIGNYTVKMTTAQKMSLYLTSKREQGRSHLYGGGISLPDAGNGIITQHLKNYLLTEDDVKRIVGSLTDKQRALADRMQAYLSGDVAEWGNRMSRYLYGYDKFTEKNYWPISSDPNYSKGEFELRQSNEVNTSLKNLGMTKALVEKASNPIEIDSAFRVFANHTTQMAAYGAYVGPLEDLNKVINWQTRHDGNWRSVKQTITAVGGDEAMRYLRNLINDVNGQAKGESGPYERLFGLAKAASVAGNLRVVVQQPTAYWRAAAIVPPQYLLTGPFGRRIDVNEMHDVAPISQWKEWGYFRDGVAGSNMLELMLGKRGAKAKFVDWSMSLAGKADDITWRQLYRATQRWVKGTTNLEPGSEAFRQEVGRRFSEVIDRTQVVDSVFKRPQSMRSRNPLWKAATSFMSEPLLNYNLFSGAATRLARAKKGEKKKAFAGMIMSAIGFSASALMAAVAQSLWDVGRDKEPDEEIIEKFMQAMFGNSINDTIKGNGKWYDIAMAAVDGNLAGSFNPMTMIPILSDVWSMIEGYEPEMMGLSSIVDVYEAGKSLHNALYEGKGKYTVGYNVVQFIRKISTATGLPVGNIYRELESLLNFSVDVAGEWLGLDTGRLEFEINKLWLRGAENTSFYYQAIMTAREKGDKQLAADIANYLLSQGVKRVSIINGLITVIYKDEENADLIQAYAQAYAAMDYNGMVQVANQAAARGISATEIQNAAKRYINSLEPEENVEQEPFEASDFDVGEVKLDNSYNVSAAVVGLLTGDSGATDDATQQMLGSGKTQDEVDTSIKTELKTKMANDMGFESISQMEEAGEEFDTTSKEYQILHDQYGYTQYEYSDLYDALVDGRGYDAIYDDMLGQTSSGDNKFTAEKIEDAMKERLQEDFNIRYKGGTGSGWEFYMNKLKEYGKSWDEILTSWKRSKAGKEWNDSH